MSKATLLESHGTFFTWQLPILLDNFPYYLTTSHMGHLTHSIEISYHKISMTFIYQCTKNNTCGMTHYITWDQYKRRKTITKYEIQNSQWHGWYNKKVKYNN